MSIKPNWPVNIPDEQCTEIESRTRAEFKISDQDLKRADWAEAVCAWIGVTVGFAAMVATISVPVGSLDVRVPIALMLVWFPATLAAVGGMERFNRRHVTARLVPAWNDYQAALSARFAVAKAVCTRTEIDRIDRM